MMNLKNLRRNHHFVTYSTFKCGVGGTTGNTGVGGGFGSAKFVALGISGSITAASYQDVPASALYADTVTLTIAY
jgi:hypothetical protein